MTRTFVKVKTDFVSIHCWKDAPEQVAFLRNLHRHIFYVTLKLEVEHDDREVEFFMLKEDLTLIVSDCKTKWPETTSCEQMAHDICKALKRNPKYSGRDMIVEVSEDNECSAIVENFIEV